MSSSELIPLFPSATHPAIPVAAEILSTLRHLTTPGKGNDLHPEEHAALVGVAALLACERVQSRDLVESSVQRASSVSQARFRSALTLARHLLDKTSSSRPTQASRANIFSSISGSPVPSTSNPTSTQPVVSPILSPFSTPKKRFKYSSGVDLSGLITSSNHHRPTQSSPLKRTTLQGRSIAQSHDFNDNDDEEEGESTPTKKSVTIAERRINSATQYHDHPKKAIHSVANIEGVDVEVLVSSNLKVPYVASSQLESRIQRKRRDKTYTETVWGADLANKRKDLLSKLS